MAYAKDEIVEEIEREIESEIIDIEDYAHSINVCVRSIRESLEELKEL